MLIVRTEDSVYMRKEFISWYTNMAAVSLFYNANMAVVMSV